jgi:hypothetical protein
MEPDPRLLAALADAMDRAADALAVNSLCGGDVRVVLPAFLADPRVAEWLAERLHATRVDRECEPGDTDCIYAHEFNAAAILGR